MSTHLQIYYHIVFGTKKRRPAIQESGSEFLYKYIWGIIKNNKCHLYRINGSTDHIHIFCDLHPTICLSNLIKDIKVASSLWIKETGIFPVFDGWQDGYGAFTCSDKDKVRVMNYIKNQKEHHKIENFLMEYKRLLEENQIKFDPKYLQ